MTTTYNPKPMQGFVRGPDGILEWHGGMGRHSYNDPKEAVKTYDKGKLRLGCGARVFSTFSSHPCGNTPKHDPDANGNPTRCGLHSAAAIVRKEAKKDATMARWKRQWNAADALHAAQKGLEEALEKIVAGHNDPRSLASETLEALKAARAESREANAKPGKG